MKKILIIAFLCFISGCATNISFDGFEYNSYISLKETADSSIELCGTPAVKANILSLKQNINHLNIYEKNKIYRPFVSEISNEMSDMVNTLYIKTIAEQEMSKTYCQIKLKNISNSAQSIYKILGQL